MRSVPSLFACLLVLGSAASALALDPRLTALGDSSLVVESETTVLSLYNLGNPAGAASLPRQNRADLAASFGSRERLAEFTTGYEGTPAQTVDVFGNTLLPFASYTRRAGALSASLDDWGATGYGGLLFWLDDRWVVQVQPLGTGLLLHSGENPAATSSLLSGVAARAAWAADPAWALGAGLAVTGGESRGWTQPDFALDAAGNTTNFADEYSRRDSKLSAELGAAWKLASVFDLKDTLDLGLTLKGARPASTVTDTLHADAAGGPALASATTESFALPAELQFQGIYSYQGSMDVGLVAGYQHERIYRQVSEALAGSTGQYLASARDNLDYEFSLRVKLPMLQENDLRFGIVFNNRGLGHPYRNGLLLTYQPDGLYAASSLQTASTSIGIGTAVVPVEDTLLCLEYFLGSTKSRRDGAILANTGYNRFNFGFQYALAEGVFLRLGYSNTRVGYQAKEFMTEQLLGTETDPVSGASNAHYYDVAVEHNVVRTSETNSYRCGFGIGEESWHADLALVYDRVSHTPEGWSMLDAPRNAVSVSQDEESSLTGVLGVSWTF